MSTTLTVLHVLMSADRDTLDNGLLASTSSSMSSAVASLDPVLVDFWSGFPCPPPWNEGLLFSVNWTSCVSQAVGDRIRWYLADRCNILIPGIGGDGQGPGGGGRGGGEEGDYESQGPSGVACDLSCKILVSLFCCLFVIVGLVVAGVFVYRRRQSRRKDVRGGQQTTAAEGRVRGRNTYAGIHYASASVVSPESERPLPPRPDGEDSGLPRQLHSYVYNPHAHNNDDDDDTLGGADPHQRQHHSFHLHLCPMNRRAAYSAMEQSPMSEEGEDFPHHYDYISDTDSAGYKRVGGGGIPRDHSHTYCSCEDREVETRMLPEHDNHAYNYPSPGLGGWEGYPGEPPDHVRPHEISKPYPRYPEEGSAFRGRTTSTAFNNGNSDVLLGFPSVPVSVIGGREGASFLPAARFHPTDLPDQGRRRHSNRGLRGQDNKAYPGVVTPEDRHPPHIISSGAALGGYPSNSGFDRSPTGRLGGYPSQEYPSDFSHSGASPTEHSSRGSSWRPEDAPYRSLLPSAGFHAVDNVYEAYPQRGHRARDERFAPNRDRAVGIHPQFYMDLLDGGTSSV